MPQYAYKCETCHANFEKMHGMFYILTRCILCNSEEGLTKLPNYFFTKSKKEENKSSPGEVVKKYIEETKKDIKQEKKRLKQKEYDD